MHAAYASTYFKKPPHASLNGASIMKGRKKQGVRRACVPETQGPCFDMISPSYAQGACTNASPWVVWFT